MQRSKGSLEKRTYAVQLKMSALGPIADIRFHLGTAFRLLFDTNVFWSRCHSALTFSQRGALDDNTDSHQDLRAMRRSL
jgi:hypothetical protein